MDDLDFLKHYRIGSDVDFDLAAIPTRDKGPFQKRKAGEAFTAEAIREIRHLQFQLFTERKQSLLIVLQAPDAAGKDGVIRKVLAHMNPQGCRTYPFKQPTAQELAHDFLWRVHPAAPAAGMVSIFNRSHYEDVLIVRVDELAPESVWRRRYEHINAFEALLHDAGTRILKFYLHISPEEQLARFRSRLDDPEKHWKLTLSDYSARERWECYRQAYHDAFERCSPDHAPWFVIPADRKWHRNAAVAGIVLQTLRQMDPQPPRPTVDLEKVRKLYAEAAERLHTEGSS